MGGAYGYRTTSKTINVCSVSASVLTLSRIFMVFWSPLTCQLKNVITPLDIEPLKLLGVISCVASDTVQHISGLAVD